MGLLIDPVCPAWIGLNDTMSDPLKKIKQKIQDELTALEHELGQLKRRMGDLGMLNLTNIPKDRAGYGSRIMVLDTRRDVKIEYKLVSTEEADAEKGFISTTSPIGKALLNRKVGDEVQVTTPAGPKEFEVVRLVTIHEEE